MWHLTIFLPLALLNQCSTKDLKFIGKEDRGSYDYRYGSANKVIVRWGGSSVVTLPSNCQPVNPVGTTKQYSRKEKKIVDVSWALLSEILKQKYGWSWQNI